MSQGRPKAGNRWRGASCGTPEAGRAARAATIHHYRRHHHHDKEHA